MTIRATWAFGLVVLICLVAASGALAGPVRGLDPYFRNAPPSVRSVLVPGTPVGHGTDAAIATQTFSSPPSLVEAPVAAAPNSAALASFYQFPCVNTWNPVTSGVGGYVIGNCYQTWSLLWTGSAGTVTDAGVSYWYYGGLVNGVFNGCGFVRQDNLNFTNYQIVTTNTVCYPATTYPATFALILNCVPGTCGGRPTQAFMRSSGSGCQMWANVRPWVNGGAPTDPIQFVPNTNPGRLNWRYITKYSHGGASYVMVQDPTPPPGGSPWGFVNVSCMASLPASGAGYGTP